MKVKLFSWTVSNGYCKYLISQWNRLYNFCHCSFFCSFFCHLSFTWIKLYHLRKRTIINPLSANPEKWSNTLKQIVGNLPTICLSMFDQFMNLALKGSRRVIIKMKMIMIRVINRSSRPEVFCKKGVIRNFAKFTGKQMCQSLFFK